METLTALDIQNKIKEFLEADETLSSYVKKFDIGNTLAARKLFPYVTVSDVNVRVSPYCIGRNAASRYDYIITIQAGTYHTLPAFACEGNGKDTKGIVQLADDVLAVVFPSNLGGMVNKPLRLVRVSHEEVKDSGGRSRIAILKLSGLRTT